MIGRAVPAERKRAGLHVTVADGKAHWVTQCAEYGEENTGPRLLFERDAPANAHLTKALAARAELKIMVSLVSTKNDMEASLEGGRWHHPSCGKLNTRHFSREGQLTLRREDMSRPDKRNTPESATRTQSNERTPSHRDAGRPKPLHFFCAICCVWKDKRGHKVG